MSAALTVPLSDYLLRVPHAVESARANERSASLQREPRELQVAADARVLYYDWVRSRLQLDVANRPWSKPGPTWPTRSAWSRSACSTRPTC